MKKSLPSITSIAVRGLFVFLPVLILVLLFTKIFQLLVALATPLAGLMFEAPLFSLKSLYARGYLTDTRFLQEAQFDNYQTFGSGLSYRLTRFSLSAIQGLPTPMTIKVPMLS